MALGRFGTIFLQHAVRAASHGVDAYSQYAAANPPRRRKGSSKGGCSPCEARARLEAHRERLGQTGPGKRAKR